MTKLTNKEIANWIRRWMKTHPDCKELDSMYEDFKSYSVSLVDTGALTKLIYGMNPLKYMTIIPSGMFYVCDFKDVIIPNNIKSIGHAAFYDCSSLTSIKIPNSVTYIGHDAFNSCIRLANIVIPNGVTSIDNRAFFKCEGLTSITIPDSVTIIEDQAFGNCKSLTSITIPDSVTIIDNWLFSGCTELTDVTISNSVKSIGGYVFYDCTELTIINYEGTKSQWNSIQLGDNWNMGSGIRQIKCTDGIIEIN